MCDNCETCKMHVKLENDRVEWAKDLTLKNIELLKQVAAQQDMIHMRDIKLMEKGVNSISEYIRSWSNPADANDESNDEEKDEVDYFDASPSVSQEALEEKMHEVNLLLEKFYADGQQFQAYLQDHDRKFTETISFLTGEIEHFREALFTEMRNSNELRADYNQRFMEIYNQSNEMVNRIVQEETLRIGNEFKSRYKDALQKSKEETETQTKLVAKLRKYNKLLRLHIQRTKYENAARFVFLEKTVQDLKKTVKTLKEKNENLHKQFKLEVEGYQNDIQDARKKIRKLNKNPQN